MAKPHYLFVISHLDWFPGSEINNHFSRQPSDDGLANEDCVEIRQSFYDGHKSTTETNHFFWNDRQCNVTNPYICQFSKTDGTYFGILVNADLIHE